MFPHSSGKYPLTVRKDGANMCSHGEQALKTENAELRAELQRQWEYNHAEHCGKPWPHQGDCYWPLPDSLADSGESQ